MEHELIAALATPMGSAALGVIRTAGAGAVEAVAELTDRRDSIRGLPGGRMRRAFIVDPENDEVIDDVVLGVFRGPHSYTGEDAVEIYCHGSVPGIQQILQLLFRSGFRPAEPGEFTQRAFLAGKLDLTRAEAVKEIVNSQTAVGHEMALQRLGGSVESAIDEIKSGLVETMARVAIQLDYPEEETGEIPIDREEVQSVRNRCADLASTYSTGRLYQEGVRVALAGRTNAGKSSLFNALLREYRAIVSDIHGTTRDYISSRIDLQGIPVELYDTAGLRDTAEVIEEEGIRRTKTVVSGTDVIVYLVDGTVGITDEDRVILDEIGYRFPDDTRRVSPDVAAAPQHSGTIVLVWNKSDLATCGAVPKEGEWISVSAATLDGIDSLIDAVVDVVKPLGLRRSGAPVIDSLRQKNLLDRAVDALDEVVTGLDNEMPVDAISVDLQDALQALGEITGEVTSEDILDAVFSGFCVGK